MSVHSLPKPDSKTLYGFTELIDCELSPQNKQAGSVEKQVYTRMALYAVGYVAQ